STPAIRLSSGCAVLLRGSFRFPVARFALVADANVKLKLGNKKQLRAAVDPRGPELCKRPSANCDGWSRWESGGVWRATARAVGDSGHPGKVGPSVGINLPKVVSKS